MDDPVSDDALAAGRGYEALFVPALFAPWTGHLIDLAGISEGSHVLDVGCGSGVLARDALAVAGAGGRVVGLDPAPGMLAAAREIAPDITWVQGGAEALPFAGAEFDCVVSQFSMMFFSDRPAAVAEMYRVLRPGGRLAVAVWNSADENPAYREVAALLDDEVGTAAGNALRVPFCLGDATPLGPLLADAGFQDVRVLTRSETARFPGARAMVEADLRGWLPLFDIILDEPTIADLLDKAEHRLAHFADGSGQVVFPSSAHLMSARKA